MPWKALAAIVKDFRKEVIQMTIDSYIVGFRVVGVGYSAVFPAVTKQQFDIMSDRDKALVVTPSVVARSLTLLNPQQQGQILHNLWNQMSWKPDPERHLGHPTVMEEFVKFVIRFLAEETYFDGRSSFATVEMAKTARRIIAEDISQGFRGDYAKHIDLGEEPKRKEADGPCNGGTGRI